MDERACTCAARNGHLEVLKYLREEVKAPVNGKVIKIAACHGDLELIRYLVENKCAGWENGYLDALDIIAKHGHFQCLKYLHEEVKLPLNGRMIDFAANRGHLEMIRYLVGKKCEGWEDGCLDALSSAVYCGEVECLKYLHEEAKAPWDWNTAAWAARNGHLHILEYLVERKYDELDEEACACAAMNGHLDCLKYLHETAKAPWDEEAVREAHKYNETECLQYLLDKNCPLPFGWRYEHGELITGYSSSSSSSSSSSLSSS